MQEEYNALCSKGTWSLVPLSPSHNLVGYKWVFKIKRKPDGSIDRYKVRLVAKGLQSSTLCLQASSILIGLKQAPRAWYDKLQGALHSLGFIGSQNDHSLFVKQSPHLVFVLVYADNILVTEPSSSECHQAISHLSNMFPIKGLGPLHYFIMIEVKRYSFGIFINQTKYILDLLQKTNMDGAKPCNTHLSTSKLDHTSPLLEDATECRSLLISFANSCMLLDFLDFLIFKLSRDFFDADWAGCSIDRRSTRGFCILVGCSIISWSAKKQPTVARSSTEPEYRSLANITAEIAWICKLLVDIGYKLPFSPQLWCDNVSSISLAKNPIFHAWTKHVEIDYHYIREKVLAKHFVHTTPTSVVALNAIPASIFTLFTIATSTFTIFTTLSSNIKLSICLITSFFLQVHPFETSSSSVSHIGRSSGTFDPLFALHVSFSPSFHPLH
ncbi:unnamed protein product [Malus baccata var. baccata]